LGTTKFIVNNRIIYKRLHTMYKINENIQNKMFISKYIQVFYLKCSCNIASRIYNHNRALVYRFAKFSVVKSK